MKIILILLLVNFLFINEANALFEDQAGSYDWRQQYVGRPFNAQIDLVSNKLYLATDQNLLGAINIKTGSIAWRKIFESNSNGKIDFTLWGSKEILIVTGNGQKIQSFNPNSGFANWEYVLFSNNSKTNTERIVGIESNHDNEVFYFINGYQICSVSIRDKACIDLPIEEGFSYTHLFERDQSVFVIGFKENFIQKIQLNSLLTSVLSKKVTNQEWVKSTENNCVKSTDSLVCYSADLNKLFNAPIKSGNQLEFSQYETQSFESGTSLIWASGDKFIFKTSYTTSDQISLFVLKKNQDQTLTVVKNVQSVESYDIILKSQTYDDFNLVYAKYKENKDLTFNVLNLKNEQKAEIVINVPSQKKDPKSIIQFKAHLSEIKSGQLSLSTFCFFEDYSMNMFNNQGVRLFNREEALAYITNVELVDFPLSRLQEEFETEFDNSQNDNILKMFLKRIKSQFFQLKEFVSVELVQKLMNYINNFKRPIVSAPSSGGQASSTSLPDEITRDEFNLNKLIIAATSVGKVFGLYTSANGRVLWSFFLKNTKPFEFNNIKNELSVPLFLQRTSAHLPHEPQCVLIRKIKINQEFKTLVYYFNPLTGEPAKDYPKDGIVLDYQIKQAFLSNTIGSNFLKPLILLDTENKLHALPEQTDNIHLKVKSNKPTVVYSANSNNNEKSSLLIGYAMKFSEKPLAELWRINIEDEVIVAIGAKQNHDKIHSHGKVLGDRSVLYKYLNPNLIGVVTTGQDGQKIPFVNVYLIDTVTGSIINSFNHKRCKGPVHIVHSENWFFYSLYNIKYRRFEVTSVELFEGSTQFNTTHFSSLDDIKPIVFTKSYIVQKAFDSMQVTLTERGIATKDIIVACQTGVIMEIPWMLIDPRRPNKMTDVEREENLLPYMPEIPLNYEFSLNYYNYVFNVRGITTSPSGLESTSLVFVYGLDIFFTRVFPSKTFDLLREDFDYFFVSTLMVGLVLGTFLSKKLASSSNLKKAWK